MELTWHALLILLPLSGLAGFVDSIAGGGGLILIPAYMLAGCPPHVAIATNKVTASMGMATAIYRYARKGYVRWKLSALCIISAIAGGVIGARLSLLINDRYFKILMIFILPLCAAVVLKGRALSEVKEEYSFIRTTLLACLVAVIIGTYDGFYGPGSGTFMLLCLAGIAHMKLNEANATAKIINFTTCLASMTVYFLNGQVVLALGLIAGAANVVGAWIGTKLFSERGADIVRPLIIIVIVIFMIKLITEII